MYSLQPHTKSQGDRKTFCPLLSLSDKSNNFLLDPLLYWWPRGEEKIWIDKKYEEEKSRHIWQRWEIELHSKTLIRHNFELSPYRLRFSFRTRAAFFKQSLKWPFFSSHVFRKETDIEFWLLSYLYDIHSRKAMLAFTQQVKPL